MVCALYNPELQKSQGQWYPANSSSKAKESDIQLIAPEEAKESDIQLIQACEKSRRFIHNKVRVWKIQKIYSQ